MARQSLTIIANAFEREKQHRRATPKRVMWTRAELGVLLNIYGRYVASGQWRDYALADGREKAIFDVFRHTHDVPLYRVEKHTKPLLYHLCDSHNRILRRGQNLPALLRYFDRKSLRAIS